MENVAFKTEEQGGEPIGMPAASAKIEPRFTVSRAEAVIAFLMIIPGYIYVSGVLEEGSLWALPVFAGILILFTEILNRRIPHPKESWFWLSLFVLLIGTVTAGRAGAFEVSGFWDRRSTSLLALHVYAVWWIMSRSGCFLEGRSSHLLPADALHAFVIIPFRNFFLRIRTMIRAVFHPARLSDDERGKKRRNLFMTLVAAVVAVWLFLIALKLLTKADAGFGRVFADFLDRLADLIRLDQDWFYNLLLALPVSAWLFGLIAGGARADKAVLRMRGEKINARLETMHSVPTLTCAILTGAFCLLYLAFFVVQAGYLFGAFTRTLPEGFIVSEYARQGFFELCKVMAVNFTLLWLVLHFAGDRLQESRLLKGMSLVLLLESLLFAVIAFSKLVLYIDCFGFTPKRLLSAWLVVVLAFGTLCGLYSLFTRKKSFTVWLYFAAASLVLISFY